jgi:ATP-dependent Clp protease ATP-binding subunit ClpB
MSEYQEKHTVSRLVGAPPGYVGYDEGGQLTEAVRRKPYSIVLFDEIEKAHPDVWSTLLQVLDDGRLTDSQGRTVSFRNTIVIMTSNLASHIILEGIDKNGELQEDARRQAMRVLQESFRPEFLNRLDEIVLFKPLLREEIGKIVRLILANTAARAASQGYTLTVADTAVEYIANHSYTPQYGARPVKRYVQREVENPLARKIISGGVAAGGEIVIDASKGGLIIN